MFTIFTKFSKQFWGDLNNICNLLIGTAFYKILGLFEVLANGEKKGNKDFQENQAEHR